MGKIQVLSFEVANLIAAGEVVDRPASAIKEMVENSIDAGAKHITVEIQNGGVSFMRVSDDGCGMTPDDLPMAVRRHATSKIRSAEDLDGILTLGFRGEALAAISSVSDMRIISKQADAEMGAELAIEGGVVLGVTERGCQNGTTVIVENLFSIVPARRKFLKRDATEAMAVSANVERVALSHPEIAFRLIVDGNLKLETAGDGNLKNTIYSVFGKDFASRLIPVDGEYEGIRVSGFIGRSDNVKANRNFQNFFINHRYVKSRTAQAAIEQAFVSYIPPEKYPCCVIEISLNPARVDVNVHPAKLEVKFSNEKPVFEAIYYTVRQALESNTTRPEISGAAFRPMTPTQKMTGMSEGSVKVSEMTTPVGEREESLKKRQLSWSGDTVVSQSKPPQIRITAEDYVRQYLGMQDEKPEKLEKNSPETQKQPGKIQIADFIATPPPPEMPMGYGGYSTLTEPAFHVEQTEEEVTEEKAPIPTYRVAGEVFNTYVIVEMEEKMLIIDKHAAHERLIFERLRANLKAKNVDTQLLMLPIEVVLMSSEVLLIKEYERELEEIGFSFACMKNTIEVSGIPSGIDAGAVPDMFEAFVKNFSEGVGDAKLTRDIIFEKALYQASCKAAIKGGREYPAGQIERLVDKLMLIPDITVCPHGRPVAMEMKKRTLDRQFERC